MEINPLQPESSSGTPANRSPKPVDVPVGRLIAWPKNPSIIMDREYQNLKRSIDEIGMPDPIIANSRNNMIISGHKRRKIAMELGWDVVPVQWYDATPSMHTKMALLFNSDKFRGFDDKDLLAEALDELSADDLSWLDYSEDDMAALQADPFDSLDDDGVGEKVEKPASVRKYSTVELREIAQDNWPNVVKEFVPFLDWLDKR